MKPEIKIGPNLDHNACQAIDALANDDTVYQLGGMLVELVQSPPPPPLCLSKQLPPRLVRIQAPSLQQYLSFLADFQKFDARSKSWVPCLPPMTIVNAVLSSTEYRYIPNVTGLANCPMLRADGSIAAEVGYDDPTGLLLNLDGWWPSPMPNEKAIALLNDILYDFPFAAPMYQGAWTAALLSLLCRAAYSGPAPFFLFDANAPGCGKGLLSNLLALFVDAGPCIRSAAPKCGDEMRKSITANLIGGSPYICWDNIKDRFGGAEIENIITADSWSDRILGVSQQIRLPVCWVLMGTGNNATLTGDMFRRVCRCRLETKDENPDRRTGFRHDNLCDYVLKYRKELVMAALSIPANYIAAARPPMGLTPWHGFDGWSDLVRQSMAFAGLPDCDTRDANKDECGDTDDHHGLLMEAWKELGKASTVRDAIRAADAEQAPTLKVLLDELGQNKSRELGSLLRKYRDKPCGGFKLTRTEHQIPQWTLTGV